MRYLFDFGQYDDREYHVFDIPEELLPAFQAIDSNNTPIVWGWGLQGIEEENVVDHLQALRRKIKSESTIRREVARAEEQEKSYRKNGFYAASGFPVFTPNIDYILEQRSKDIEYNFKLDLLIERINKSNEI